MKHLSALIKATDLASTPNSGLNVQLCADADMADFGIYASPERRLVLDINGMEGERRGQEVEAEG